MKQFHARKLPPCPLSVECLRLVGELDDASGYVRTRPVFSADDTRDVLLLEQLRSHIPGCSTCTAILEEARRVRLRQRRVLRDLLEDNQQAVPSTVEAIMAATVHEPNPLLTAGINHHQDISTVPTVELEDPRVISLTQRRRPHMRDDGQEYNTHTTLRTILSLAVVAAVILSAIAAFSRFVIVTPQLGKGAVTAQAMASATTVAPLAIGWKSVAIGFSNLANAGRTDVDNYDPLGGHSRRLVASHLPANTQLDGIAHEGLNLLYQFSSDGRVYYNTLVAPIKGGSFYALDQSDAGNAIWMDKDHALIATVHEGVKQVDIHSGAAFALLPNLHAVQLVLYRVPYLYFTGGAVAGALYRTVVTDGVPTKVTTPSPGSTFWISPDGTTVFYQNKGSHGGQAIYAASGDGTRYWVLRPGAATPIGYADNYALMLLQEVKGKFQVIRLGATPWEHETVVLDDAAPGAVSLCTSDVPPGIIPICGSNAALAPYGHGLILHSYYPDGTSKILYDDLAAGQSRVLVNLGKNAIQVQLPGWDKLPVS